MGAIVMDGAVIGEDSVVGAGALVVEGTVVPPKSVILGSPGRVRRGASEAELAWIKESAANYMNPACGSSSRCPRSNLHKAHRIPDQGRWKLLLFNEVRDILAMAPVGDPYHFFG
ncbi:hypothetical protein B566_EDAN000163 [Ephemera danica]|nr:hypothetical protein B566_EDAN000163 [Ephemera danica]